MRTALCGSAMLPRGAAAALQATHSRSLPDRLQAGQQPSPGHWGRLAALMHGGPLRLLPGRFSASTQRSWLVAACTIVQVLCWCLNWATCLCAGVSVASMDVLRDREGITGKGPEPLHKAGSVPTASRCPGPHAPRWAEPHGLWHQSQLWPLLLPTQEPCVDQVRLSPQRLSSLRGAARLGSHSRNLRTSLSRASAKAKSWARSRLLMPTAKCRRPMRSCRRRPAPRAWG